MLSEEWGEGCGVKGRLLTSSLNTMSNNDRPFSQHVKPNYMGIDKGAGPFNCLYLTLSDDW